MTSIDGNIAITFIDDRSGEVFAKTEMPAQELPESFELTTTLHLGDEDWSVIEAQPKRREEFASSRFLVLRLRRIERIDPKKILYSLPSIYDPIPALSDEPLAGDELTIHEDDWRRMELVSRAYGEIIDEEIAKVREIHENESASFGWRNIHVRKRPEQPLDVQITFDELWDAFDSSARPSGLSYWDAQSRIADGYSLHMHGGLQVYGITRKNIVRVIAFDDNQLPEPGEWLGAVAHLAQECNLDLVQWCRCIRVSHDDPRFVELLTGSL